jgi:hypothetical protein
VDADGDRGRMNARRSGTGWDLPSPADANKSAVVDPRSRCIFAFRGYGSKRAHRKSANRLPDLRSDRQVASRLPGRKKVCPECGGTGHVNFKRRQQLPAKVKAKERG